MATLKFMDREHPVSGVNPGANSREEGQSTGRADAVDRLESAQPAPDAANGKPRVLVALLQYSALRLLLVAAITAVLMTFMPLIVAVLFAIVIQLPLAWLLFAGPRRRLNAEISRASADRRAYRARLDAALADRRHGVDQRPGVDQGHGPDRPH